MTPDPVTLGESIARMAERIRDLEETERLLRAALTMADAVINADYTVILDLRQENLELRQQLDLVTDREREGRGWTA